MTQLVDDGNPHLRTAEIAERAEVSVRSIFHHLPDLEALYLSVVDAQLRGILADLQPVRTQGNLDERVSALVSERAKLSERALPMRKLAARFEALSDASRARGRFGRDVQRRRGEIAFQPKLAQVAEADRAELLDHALFYVGELS